MTIIKGTYTTIWFVVLAAILILGSINLSKSGKYVPKIRRIAGLDAIEEAVGRATEMGRPVHFSPGIAAIDGETAPQTFAGLEILGYVTSLCAKYSADLICTIRIANVYPLAEEVVRQAYLAADKADLFKDDTVRFLSSDQFAYAAGAQGIMHREKTAANIMMGGFWAESLFMAEAAAQVGAIQVAGTANMHQIPFFVAACDYTLIGEELYAGGAYLSQDRVKVGSIAGQDYVKFIVMACVLIGALSRTFNNTWFINLLAK